MQFLEDLRRPSFRPAFVTYDVKWFDALFGNGALPGVRPRLPRLAGLGPSCAFIPPPCLRMIVS